jgi:hypothetical protein
MFGGNITAIPGHTNFSVDSGNGLQSSNRSPDIPLSSC